ncbi:MAG: hypothetical protein QM775_13310 [Pirellulales bacterium]
MIGANSNQNVFESLNMALGGGNVAFNNVQFHGNTSIQGGGTLTIGIHGALDQTLFDNHLGAVQFNGNTHPAFASSNSAIGLAVLQPSALLGRATLNPTLTIRNDIYFSGDLGVNTNNGNDVIFTGRVYLGNSLERPTEGAEGASRFFNIGNAGTPGRVYFRGNIVDGTTVSGAHDNQVIKQGVGVMHMEGVNTYTGNTHILAGFIALTTDNDIPKFSPGQSVFFQGGGLAVWEAAPTANTFINGERDATRRFSDTMIIYQQAAGPYGVANSPNGFGIFDIAAGLRFSQVGGSLSGGGTLIKQGQGTLVLGAIRPTIFRPAMPSRSRTRSRALTLPAAFCSSILWLRPAIPHSPVRCPCRSLPRPLPPARTSRPSAPRPGWLPACRSTDRTFPSVPRFLRSPARRRSHSTAMPAVRQVRLPQVASPLNSPHL